MRQCSGSTTFRSACCCASSGRFILRSSISGRRRYRLSTSVVADRPFFWRYRPPVLVVANRPFSWRYRSAVLVIANRTLFRRYRSAVLVIANRPFSWRYRSAVRIAFPLVFLIHVICLSYKSIKINIFHYTDSFTKLQLFSCFQFVKKLFSRGSFPQLKSL